MTELLICEVVHRTRAPPSREGSDFETGPSVRESSPILVGRLLPPSDVDLGFPKMSHSLSLGVSKPINAQSRTRFYICGVWSPPPAFYRDLLARTYTYAPSMSSTVGSIFRKLSPRRRDLDEQVKAEAVYRARVRSEKLEYVRINSLLKDPHVFAGPWPEHLRDPRYHLHRA